MATKTDTGPRVSANAAALIIADATGRPVTAKQVRSVAREAMPAYQDEAYTRHAYSKTDVLLLLDLFQSRAGRAGIAGTGPEGQVTSKDARGVLGITDADLKGKGSADAS